MKKILFTTALLLAAIFAFAACGDDRGKVSASPSASAAASTVPDGSGSPTVMPELVPTEQISAAPSDNSGSSLSPSASSSAGESPAPSGKTSSSAAPSATGSAKK